MLIAEYFYTLGDLRRKDAAYNYHNPLGLGIEIETLPIDQTWLWREARLKDLDGNQLILFYGGRNRKNPPWKIIL